MSVFIWVVLFLTSALSIRVSGRREESVNPGGDLLDCGMRRLFFEQAKKAVPWRHSMMDVFDALELGTLRCSDLYDDDISSSMNRIDDDFAEEIDAGHHNAFYVCPDKGNDDHSGSKTHPFLTIHRALEATRNLARSDDVSTTKTRVRKTIILYQGIHFLSKTITLTAPLDSNLTIRSESARTPDGVPTAWISGGFPINSQTTDWKPSHRHNIWVANLTSIIDDIADDTITEITGLFTTNPNHRRMTLARYPNANVEDWDASGRYVPTVKGGNATDDYEWIFPQPSSLPEFHSIDLSQPNNPTGHVKNDSSMTYYNWFGTGTGGSCASVWGDEPSYWCSNISDGGWAEVDKLAVEAGRPNIPVGIIIHNETLVKRFTQWATTKRGSNPRGAVFHVQHTQSWAWHMFNVSHVDESSDPTKLTIHFDKGGSQGGRNWQCVDVSTDKLSDCNGENKKLRSGEWYIEGLFAELDEKEEFFYDSQSNLLYFYPEHTACNHGPDTSMFASIGRRLLGRRQQQQQQQHAKKSSHSCIPDLIATNLKTLIKLEGSMENPLQGVQLTGIGFRDAAKTYMERWGVPSGGDWALHRGGAVHLDGTEDVRISDCHFRRLDGNAVMLSGYNRYAHVTRSEFSWIGNGAMATWGETENGYDATGGAQPRYSTIDKNVISNIGLYQKQSSGWGQNKACHNYIRDNVIYNVPRAAINFNDGLGGGNIVQGNIIFNTCRESGDHGAINSWDRMPFLVDSETGPSFTPLPTLTFGNLILANYNAAQGFDNDDGSSWYYTHENVFYSAMGFKMDYGGVASKFNNNLVYGNEGSCYGTGDFLNKNLADVFQGNTCIMDEVNTTNEIIMGHLFQCSVEDGMVPAKNSYYSRNGKGVFICGQKHLTLEAIQQEGFEIGSTIGVSPDAETIISWAREVLRQRDQKGHDEEEGTEKKTGVLVVVWAIVIILLIVVVCYIFRDDMRVASNGILRWVRDLRASSSSGNVRESLLDHNVFETSDTSNPIA